eukprot:1131025-Alexandrium_andersonii.AAC.1
MACKPPDETLQGGTVEAVAGSAQFKLRTPEAFVSHVPQGGDQNNYTKAQPYVVCCLESALADILCKG